MDISSIYKTLSYKEKSILLSYYFDKGKQSKRLQFLKALEQEENISDNTLSEIVYGRTDVTPKFSQLKARVFRDILNIIQISYVNDGSASRSTLIRYSLRQYINDSELLMSRGLDELGIEMLEKAFRYSSRYQCHIESMIIADLLQQYKGLRNDSKSYRKYFESKLLALKTCEKRFKASEIFMQITRPSFFTLETIDYNELLRNLINLDSGTQSDDIRGMTLRAEAFIRMKGGEYKRAYDSASEYLLLVTTSNVLKSLNNIGGANMQISIIEIERENYSRSIDHATVALNHFKKDSANELRALEVRFISSLRLKHYGSCTTDVSYALKSKAIRTSVIMQTTWDFRKALLSFLMDDYESAQKVLVSDNENRLKGTHWRYYYRVLDICNLYAMKKYDIVEYRLDAFAKLMSHDKIVSDSRLYIFWNVMKKFTRLSLGIRANKREQVQILKSECKAKFVESRIKIDNSLEIIPIDDLIYHALGKLNF